MTNTMTPPVMRRINWFTYLRHRLCRLIAPDLLFNSDMSQEIDRLTLEKERLSRVIRDYESL